MTPFILKARLFTPCVYNRPVRLPGLLYHALLAHHCDEEKAASELKKLFKETDGVLHGSSLIFGIKPDAPVVACYHPTIGAMKNEIDFSKHLISPNGRGGKYSKVTLTGGATGTKIVKNNAYHAPFITFFGYGDAEKIVSLLNHYVSSVGIYANRGAGTLDVDGWSAQKIQEDHSLIDVSGRTGEINKGMPLAPLPDELFKRLSPEKYGEHDVEQSSLVPPYHKGVNACLCAVPEKVSRQLV